MIEIDNKIINAPIDIILHKLQSELHNGKLRDIGRAHGNNIAVTCPIHKDGKENKASCNIFTGDSSEGTPYGWAHCFTCGYSSSIFGFIADCFDEDGDEEFGKEWLLNRFSTVFISEVEYLPPIVLKKETSKQTLDEAILKNYDYYHDYMWKRKLSKEVVDLFEVGYDPKKDRITFPVRDEKGDLIFITARSVKGKQFFIPPEVDKPVYLLYYIKQHNITHVAVAESQINALYLWSLGISAVALFGTGSHKQLETLAKSGVRHFDLYFDGDAAGRRGAARFKNIMPKDIIITDYSLPMGKDVNDLSPVEIEKLVGD